MKAADAAGTAELKFLLARQDVSTDNQRLFFHRRITTVEMLANVAKDRGDLVDMLKQRWGLDKDNSLTERVQVAGIACAWANASTRSQRSAEVEAEYDVQDKPTPLIAGEWTSMRAALERRQGVIEDRVMPAREYIEKKRSEVESAEYRAEAFSEVVSKDEVDVDSLVPVFKCQGNHAPKEGIEQSGGSYECRRVPQAHDYHVPCDDPHLIETYESTRTPG